MWLPGILAGRTKENRQRARRWIQFGQICRKIRNEFCSYQQENTIFKLALVSMEQHLKLFPLRGEIPLQTHLQIDPHAIAKADFLPIFEILRRMPRVYIKKVHPINLLDEEKLLAVVKQLFEENKSLRAYVAGFGAGKCPIASIRFVKPLESFGLGPCLEIIFKAKFQEGWMDRTFCTSKDGATIPRGRREAEMGEEQDAMEMFLDVAGLGGILEDVGYIGFGIAKE